MEIRHLQYFLAVVDEGGVNKAADALRVAQPSLSQALRKFEQTQGTALFHRVGRGLVLTPAGEALVGPARTVLRDVEEAENALRDIRSVRRGRIDIATLSDVSTEPLSTWIGQFRLRFPDVRFRISEYDAVSDVVREVRQGTSEIGLVPTSPGEDEGLAERFVVTQQFVLVLPPGAEVPGDGPIDVATLATIPLVAGDPGSTTSMQIDTYLRDNGVSPRVVVELPHRGAVMPVVYAGGGAAIVPLRVAVEGSRRGAQIRLLNPPLTRNLRIVHRPGRLTEATAEFLGFSQELLRQWYRALDRRAGQGQDVVAAALHTREAIERRIHRPTRSAAPDDR